MPLVAVAQFAPGPDSAANADTMRSLAAEAQALGAALVAFPEYSSFFEPRMGPRFAEHAEDLDGPFTAAMVAAADKAELTVVFGLVERAGERFRNAAVAVDGPVCAPSTARRISTTPSAPARAAGWSRDRSTTPAVFEVGGLRVGLQTCYDVRFPEVTRRIADAGADLVVMPADWVPGPRKVEHWRTLVTARAIENTLYVAAAGQVPPGGVGTSLVVDPQGDVLTELGEGPGSARGRRGPQVAAVREVNPALALRRYAVVPRA